MVQNSAHPRRYSSALRAPLSLLLVCSGLLLGLGLVAVARIFSYPQGDYFFPGLVRSFPPSDEPYEFQNQGFFLVNTGIELLALSDEHPDPTHCRNRWFPQVGRFIEPCRGTQFGLNGLYHSGPPAAMSRYPVEIVEDKVRVELLQREPGPSLPGDWQDP